MVDLVPRPSEGDSGKELIPSLGTCFIDRNAAGELKELIQHRILLFRLLE